MKKFLAIVLCLTLVLTCFTALLGCAEVKTGQLEEGKIYSLQEAYEINAISYNDLLSIACHSGNRENNQIDKNFKPTEINELNEDISLKIKECLAKNETGKNVDDYQILHYYGCYNGAHSFDYIDTTCFEPTVEIPFTETVGGINFHYVSSYRIIMCRV